MFQLLPFSNCISTMFHVISVIFLHPTNQAISVSLKSGCEVDKFFMVFYQATCRRCTLPETNTVSRKSLFGEGANETSLGWLFLIGDEILPSYMGITK